MITIVVLIILATVSINVLFSENGIISKAEQAKELNRAGSVEEQVAMWKSDQSLAKYTGTSAQTRNEFLADLVSKGLLTPEEKATVEGTGSVTIGGKTINFGNTLGDVYTDDMIGQSVTYSANEQTDWIIFGKDSEGNILITTELPIDDGFNLKGGAYSWLTYKDDLNTACSGYGSTVQGMTVISRSITMDDINYVAGFTKPTFDTYTFGTTHGYNSSTREWDSYNVNYYYPSLNASANGYWQQPTAGNETTFQNDWYGYYCNWNSGEYFYRGADTDGNDIPAADRNLKTYNFKYIWGGDTEATCYNGYLVASRSVDVRSGEAYFNEARVSGSEAATGNYYLCCSDAGGDYDGSDDGLLGVRPVVVLPSNIQVEQNESGLWDIVYQNTQKQQMDNYYVGKNQGGLWSPREMRWKMSIIDTVKTIKRMHVQE